MLEKLIGCKLKEINKNYIKVLNDKNEELKIEIVEDYGDCCGYNEVTANLLISSEELERNPIITEIKKETDNPAESDGEIVIITFFGEYKKIAELHSLSSSGSGWGYGANVKLVCQILDEDETLSQW